MKIRDQERYVVTLVAIIRAAIAEDVRHHLYRFSPEYEERLCSLCQETCEFVDQNIFDLVGLLDFYADPNTIYARFDEDPLIFVP